MRGGNCGFLFKIFCLYRNGIDSNFNILVMYFVGIS